VAASRGLLSGIRHIINNDSRHMQDERVNGTLSSCDLLVLWTTVCWWSSVVGWSELRVYVTGRWRGRLPAPTEFSRTRPQLQTRSDRLHARYWRNNGLLRHLSHQPYDMYNDLYQRRTRVAYINGWVGFCWIFYWLGWFGSQYLIKILKRHFWSILTNFRYKLHTYICVCNQLVRMKYVVNYG